MSTIIRSIPLKTAATFTDVYGHDATIRYLSMGGFQLEVFTDGKTSFRRNYKTWRGARKALNRFSNAWHEIK